MRRFNENWPDAKARWKPRRSELPRVSIASVVRSGASKLAQQALFAFVDSLVKTLLTCIAEPPSDAHDQAVAQGKFRYDRFLKSVGAAMAGDSKAAMAELVKRSEPANSDPAPKDCANRRHG